MHILKRTITTLALAALLVGGAAAPATAGLFSNLIVFGDSIVDTGNVQAGAIAAGFPDPAPAAFGYFEGRFSNGPVVSDVVNQWLEGQNIGGFSTVGGDNYAFGGARARTDADFVPDLTAQLGFFFGTASVDPDALYLINAGGNDVRDIVLDGLVGSARQQVIDDATAAVTGAVGALQAAGANHILYVGVGNVGTIPEVLAEGIPAAEAGFQASLDLNASIFDALPSDVRIFDTIAFFTELALDPAAFGLPADIDFFTPCLFATAADPVGAPTCSGFGFFDAVHPTTALHQALGDAIVAAIPEPSTATLLVVGLGLLGARRRRA